MRMSSVTYEWVVLCHIWMSYVTYEWVTYWVMSHMNESPTVCATMNRKRMGEVVMSDGSESCHMCCVSRVQLIISRVEGDSWRSSDLFVTHLRMWYDSFMTLNITRRRGFSHVTHMKCHMRMSHVKCEWVMSIWMSHVTQVKKSSLMCQWVMLRMWIRHVTGEWAMSPVWNGHGVCTTGYTSG